MAQELIQFDVIRKAIQKAASIDEAKGIRDKAEALRIYVKQSGQSLEVLNRCAEIKLRAERRAGEILSEMDKNKGARGKGVRFHDESTPTLADLGISPVQSHRWQKIASIPSREFEAFLGSTKRQQGELTSISVLRLANELSRKIKPERESSELEILSQPLYSAGEVFSTVVVDPPWDHLGRKTHDLWSLPIPAMCARNAHLYLWVTNKALEQGFDLLRLWGFRYVTCLTWCRSSEGGPDLRASTEHILVGVRGTLELAPQDLGAWYQWPWGSIHSEKPDRFYDLVMSCSPGPYAVLFSKKQRPGWTCARLDLKAMATKRNERVSQSFTPGGYSKPPVAGVHFTT